MRGGGAAPIKLPAVTPKLSETPGETKWLGYDEAMIVALKAERVI